MFINTCFAASGQNEFYNDRYTDSVSIDFLHQYILANYRTVYARVLSAGINHFSQVLIIRNLLKAGAPVDSEERFEEGQLIAAALRQLPANRVYKLFARLRRESVNNRRSRAVVRDYLRFRQFKSFHFVKYRNKLRQIVRHSHVAVSQETSRFLFSLKSCKQFEDPLYDTFLRAQYSKQAVFELPFTVAEGVADRHGIERDGFLRKIAPMMTRAEKLRMQNAASRADRVSIDVDLATAPLTRLALYVLSLPLQQRKERAEELQAALSNAAKRIASQSSLRLQKTAAVLDRSRSTWGSRERRRRPLAIAVAMHYLLSAASNEFCSFWTPAHDNTPTRYVADDYVFLVESGGQTDLATPLLDALEWLPKDVVIVSDGFENAPAGAANQIVHAYQKCLQAHQPINFIHANPVFDAEHFSPKRLGDSLLTIGLRDAEDMPASLRFSKFAAGEETQTELETFLGQLAKKYVQQAFKSLGQLELSEDDAS